MSTSAEDRLLTAAQIWRDWDGAADGASDVPAPSAAGPRSSSGSPAPRLVVGWEAAYPFCAAICSTVAGLEFCQRCAEGVVSSVLRTRRAAGGTCGAGVRLLAFPASTRRHRPPEVVVLRVAPPTTRHAGRIAPIAHVAPASLRRAARESPPSRGVDVLRAARRLRSTSGRLAWQVAERKRSADRQRAASATLAQFIVATEELQALYRSAVRQRQELQRARDAADRLARDAVRVRQREHAQIAHQVHDTVAQSMVSAVRFLDAAASEVRAWETPRELPRSRAGRSTAREATERAKLEGVIDHLDLAQERLRAAIHELRAILDELTPAGLAQGLDHAVRFRHQDLLVDAGMNGGVQGSLPRLEPWVEQVVYGMVSEAMTNAARHSGGRTLSVACSTVRDRVVIVVRDDGIGTAGWGARIGTTRRRGASGGLGLVGLLRQARWLGGTVGFRDNVGGGTAVRISIPLSRHLVRRPGSEDRPAEARR